jgi:hypothetical protein
MIRTTGIMELWNGGIMTGQSPPSIPSFHYSNIPALERRP